MAKVNKLLFDGLSSFFSHASIGSSKTPAGVKFSPLRCLCQLLMNILSLCAIGAPLLNSSHARQDGLFLKRENLIGRATRAVTTFPKGRERIATATDVAC